VWWHVPVIKVQPSLGKKARPYLQKKLEQNGLEVLQSKYKALSSKLSSTKTKTKSKTPENFISLACSVFGCPLSFCPPLMASLDLPLP
jgi:hypothetical protein